MAPPSKKLKTDCGETDVIDSDVEKKDNPDYTLEKFSQIAGRQHDELFQKTLEEKLVLQQELDKAKKTLEEKLLLQQELDKAKKTLEEKLLLQQELDKAKKIATEKARELNEIQKQLMLEGEDDAMSKDETTYFPLSAERAYTEGSASQFHFRLAESQFYRHLTGPALTSVRVTKVEYVVSPKVVKRFRECQERLKKTRGESNSFAILGFHGTDQKNIRPICENGFKGPGDEGFRHQTDSGYYGAGVYFSEFTNYSIAYIRGCSELMLCQILPGKVYECTGLIHGAKLREGYDSHMSPCKNEIVIFQTDAILPRYIISFQRATGPLTYFQIPALSSYKKAVVAKSSKVFKGISFTLFGKMSEYQATLYKLLRKHGGQKAVLGKADVIVTTSKLSTGSSEVISAAKTKHVPIVKEDYIYQCIVQKKKLSFEEYKL